jgi:iron complex transport system ATP-binding protein
VDVGYDGAAVVRGADLVVCGGELVGLVGPNAAGKSTLLKAITGDSELLGGSIEVAGVDADALDAAARARLVGVVPQQTSAAFGVLADDFVTMGRNPHLPRFGGPRDADFEIVARAMRLTDTSRLAGLPTDELSGGDMQRLALAQALAQEPRLLLLDEPVSHLDLNHRLQVLDLVRELADQGMAVLAVFHDLDLAARYSDRLAVVAEGALRSADVPERVLTAETISSVFGVRAVISTDPVAGTVVVTPVVREQAVATRAGERGRLFVVAGSGRGALLMRRLTLAGWELVAGALNEGDVDHGVAVALGVEHAAVAPFAAIDDAARALTRELIKRVDAVVVCDVPFGGSNLANLEIAVEAASAGRPVLLVGQIEGRDFANGEATQLWRRATDAGAIVVGDASAVPATLDSLFGG